jgi:hypothetical protein
MMTPGQTENLLNFTGIVRLIVQRKPWRFAFLLTNPQVGKRTARGLILQRNLGEGMSLDDVRWLIQSSPTYSLQFDEGRGEEEYGVYHVKLTNMQDHSSSLLVEFTPYASHEDFTLLIGH